MTVRNIKDENEMSVFGLPGVTGVLVTNLDSRSNLAKAGLAVDDVILDVNGQPISSVDDLRKIVPSARPFTIAISRGQNPLTLKCASDH